MEMEMEEGRPRGAVRGRNVGPSLLLPGGLARDRPSCQRRVAEPDYRRRLHATITRKGDEKAWALLPQQMRSEHGPRENHTTHTHAHPCPQASQAHSTRLLVVGRADALAV